MTTTIATLVVFAVTPAGPQGAVSPSVTPPAESPTLPHLPDVDPELLRLVVDDQWDRGVDMFSGRQVKMPDTLDVQRIAERDAERRTKARTLLAQGKVRSGREHQFTALLFQHSDTTE